jgi:hypothetical protein
MRELYVSECRRLRPVSGHRATSLTQRSAWKVREGDLRGARIARPRGIRAGYSAQIKQER